MASFVLLVMFFVGAICGSCVEGSVYKVGDALGWAIIGNIDYNAWASSKAFEVGDTLVFEYVPRFHNVLQVSRSDFHTCNSAAPISTYATGNDSVIIGGPGHYYYICGFVGHCAAGQKVDIRVPKSRRPVVTILSPAQAPGVSPIGPIAPSPSPSGADSVVLNNFNVGLLLLLPILFWAFK